MQLTASAQFRLTFLSLIMFLLLIISLLRLGTAEKSQVRIITVKQDTQPEKLQKSVKAFVQPRPGASMQETQMRVHQTPNDLPIVNANEVELEDDDLVLGVVVGDSVVAYPIRYLAMFEVTNCQIGDIPVAPTWCPLTATGVVYLRTVGDQQLTFDFAEGLLNNNLLIVDRQTDSVWSQLDQSAISGPMKGTKLKALPAIQSTWKYWLDKHPDTLVMTFKGRDGRRYIYRNREIGRSGPRSRPASHDTSALGLGLHFADQAHYFPFTELKKAQLPIELTLADKLVTIHYEEDALSAWAEDAEGKLLPAVLVYQSRWSAFNPKSTIFEARVNNE